MPSNKDAQLCVYGLVPDSIVDGPGLRYVVFVQGCTHGCPGCHNPESQPSEGGMWYSLDAIHDDIVANKLIHAVTFSGGEPFEQPEACALLAERLKSEGYNIWAYTGYLFEDLLRMAKDDAIEQAPHIAAFLGNIDVLVDGPFVSALQSLDLKWRGSSNQRIIDVSATLASGAVVEWHAPAFELEQPPSW